MSYSTGFCFPQITRCEAPADAGYKVCWPEGWVSPSTPVLNQLLLAGRAEVVDGVAVCGQPAVVEKKVPLAHGLETCCKVKKQELCDSYRCCLSGIFILNFSCLLCGVCSL